MDTELLLKDLDQIFCHVLNKTILNLREETTANDVEGWNSLSNMQIISEIEKYFNIQFKLREIIKMKNVGDLCRIISKKLSA